MHVLYCSTKDLQSAAGSLALEKSIHSSRLDFSSLQTQQGYSNMLGEDVEARGCQDEPWGERRAQRKWRLPLLQELVNKERLDGGKVTSGLTDW